jgi:hypothetical protein
VTAPAAVAPVDAALAAGALLAAWEEGSGLAPGQRATAVLHHACPPGAPSAPDGWSVGRRDSFLLAVRAATFGDDVAGATPCPGCGSDVEVSFRVADVEAATGDAGEEMELTSRDGTWRVRFRLPTAADVAAAAEAPSWHRGRRLLGERCVVEAERSGQPVPAESVPDDVLGDMAAVMAERDPQADVRLRIECPACNHEWEVPFDVADFVWRELVTEGRRLATEVSGLAAAYGWSEAEILSLSGWRRKLYLELAET